jgi:hypothetical protein
MKYVIILDIQRVSYQIIKIMAWVINTKIKGNPDPYTYLNMIGTRMTGYGV